MLRLSAICVQILNFFVTSTLKVHRLYSTVVRSRSSQQFARFRRFHSSVLTNNRIGNILRKIYGYITHKTHHSTWFYALPQPDLKQHNRHHLALTNVAATNSTFPSLFRPRIVSDFTINHGKLSMCSSEGIAWFSLLT